MNPNPYEPPGTHGAPLAAAASASRGPFVLAAIGAWFAGAYWAAITLLLMMGVAAGSVSGAQIILPFVLIGLYVMRGYQIWNGDPAAARRILWLHGVGAIAAVAQMQSSSGFVVALQGIKVLIHMFGGATAYLAQRAVAQAARP